MRSKSIIYSILVLLINNLSGQNYGYMGRKNVVYAMGSVNTGFYTKPIDEKRVGIGLERTLGRSISCYAEFQMLTKIFDMSGGPHNRVFLQKYTPWLDRDYMDIQHVNCTIYTKAIDLGLKFFFRGTGSVAPFGSYFTCRTDYNFQTLHTNSIAARLSYNYNGTREMLFEHIPDLRQNTAFINIGFGNSRVYANRILSDFSMGMGTSYFNTSPYRYSIIKYPNYEFTNPEDWLKARIAHYNVGSRAIWIKYKLGYIF